jgi:hypothetical protein
MEEDDGSMRPTTPHGGPARHSTVSTSGGMGTGMFHGGIADLGIDGVVQEEESCWQYHEPWSWASICSDPGSKWIYDMTESRDFVALAKRFFAKDLMRPAGNDKPMPPLGPSSPLEEVDEATAWEYVDGK